MARKDREIIDRLVRQAQAGDRTAFSQLVRLTMKDIVALTYRMTGDRDTAHDLAQETFVSAWQHLGGFREEARFENWLYRIASNKALNHLSRGATVRVASLEAAVATGHDRASDDVQPDRLLEQAQLRDDIFSFMQQLPPQQRLVFELRFYQQLGFAEIAEMTGKALGTIKTNYREAVGKLRTYATERGWR